MRKLVATGNVSYLNPSSNIDILKQINDVLKGIASDISQIVYEYNNEVYPVLSTLPQGVVDTRWTLTNDNCPRVEGLDGRGVFVDNESTLATDSGKYWYSTYSRPKTIKEALADLDARITSISNSTESSDALLRAAGDFNTFTLKATPASSDLVLIEDSASSYAKKKVLVSSLGGGTVTAASNVGTGGIGLFKQLSGTTLQFKNINAGSSKITVTNDSGNNEVDIDASISKSDVGLSSVTDDAQLKRSANDFDGFGNKGTPHNNDRILIEDSEEGTPYTKKYVTWSQLPAGGGGLTEAEIRLLVMGTCGGI